MQKNRIGILVAFATVLLCGVWVSAQSTDPDRGIPFRGHLELNGTPIDGVVELALSLSDDEAGLNELWTAERSVQVNAGAFSVVLGAENTLPVGVFDANALYVTVGVVTSPSSTINIGTQQVFAAFQSVTSTDADRAQTATYAERAQNLLIERHGATSRIAFQSSVNDTGEIVHHEVNNVGNLWLSSSDDWDTGADNDRIIFGEQSSNSRRHVFVANGNARHSGDLQVDGDLNVTGAINGDFALSAQSTAERRNSAGSGETNLGTTTRRFCFLTLVEMEDIDANGENAICEVYSNAGTWRVRARLGSTPDADVVCGARCFTY